MTGLTDRVISRLSEQDISQIIIRIIKQIGGSGRCDRRSGKGRNRMARDAKKMRLEPG
jgi:hypothetical protein